MSQTEKPNLFKIATKELHQDAFITWLLKWAAPANNGHELNLCGQDFVKRLISKQFDSNDIEIKSLNAGRQWENIDVWAVVNNDYLIIIEDKTFTGEHSKQLHRYREIAKDWCSKNSYSKLVCIYLKTGSEAKSSLDKIESYGFSVFGRNDLLKFLEDYKEIKNEIFRDFYLYLKELDDAHNAFELNPINEWRNFGYAWPGFFLHLEAKIPGFNWFWVNNISGGFWAAIISWEYWKGFPIYIQIEQERVCFKIGFAEDEIDTEEEFKPNQIQDEWQNYLLSMASKLGITELERPYPYVHRGSYRTVATILPNQWLCDTNQKLDKFKAVSLLLRLQEFHKDILK